VDSKLINLVVDQVLGNKRADSIFIFAAGMIAVWAITGGPSDLFDGKTVKKLQAKAVIDTKKMNECKDEVAKLKASLAEDAKLLEELRLENRFVAQENKLLKLVISQNGGTVPIPASIPPDPVPEG